ncbi:MAG: 4-oxalocrotonate tautomerase family enzyme [Peptococcaceae bacterium]|jgi:4-oxalocrotonate tautomerase|nr:4-oxalocrotonate tautomerase family enzyme [Peptococcaceae bacterium]
MPVVQIEMIGGRTIEQKRAMVKEVTDALVRTINCKPEAVKIIIRDMEKHNIADGGVLKCDQ